MSAKPLFDATTREFLRALASESRQQILMLFALGDSFTVGEVAERFAIGQSTASEQLSALKHGGLLIAEREGKLVRYRADAESIRSQLGLLAGHLSHCCGPVPGLSIPEPGDRPSLLARTDS